MRKTILTALAATPCMMTMNAQPKLSATNIDEVIQAMTLEEKAKLLVGGSNNFFGDQAAVGGEATLVAGAAGTSPEIARLGIPALPACVSTPPAKVLLRLIMPLDFPSVPVWLRHGIRNL